MKMNKCVSSFKRACGLILLAGTVFGIFFTGIVVSADAAPLVKLKVLDPRAEISTPPPVPISARLSSLSGKKIGILNNTKEGARAFQPYLEKMLKEVEPTVELKTWTIPYNDYATKEKDLQEIAKWSDAVIGFIGD